MNLMVGLALLQPPKHRFRRSTATDTDSLTDVAIRWQI